MLIIADLKDNADMLRIGRSRGADFRALIANADKVPLSRDSPNAEITTLLDKCTS